jgi:serine/threonine protein kinase/WD40 repeat protein
MNQPESHAKPVPPKLPESIGGCRIERVLGFGGMATVYAAMQDQPRRRVAVKVVRGAAGTGPALHRFKREIEILGRLRHPTIAQVYSAGVHNDGGGDVPFFVMEYVPGARTVAEFAETHELSIRSRLKLFVRICAGVGHGHKHRVIHRDLKPGNILIDEHGEPKIIDFGVARITEFDVSSQTMQTEAGRLIGTIQYMAPEQLETEKLDLDARCDVYSLGVLLYKLLTGKMPHDVKGLPVYAAAQVIKEDTPPRPSAIRPDLKGDLETIILKALAKDRTRRYRDAAALGRDIVRYLTNKPIEARKAGRLHRFRLFARRRRTELIASLAVLIVLVAAAAIILKISMNNADAPPTDDATRAQSSPAADVATIAPADERTDIILTESGPQAAALALSPDGAMLARGAHDKSIVIWDVQSRDSILSAADHDAAVAHVRFTGDNSMIVSAADDGNIVIIDISTARIVKVVHHSCAGVDAFAMNHDATLFALSCDDLTLRLYNRDGHRVRTIRGARGAFNNFDIHPQRNLIVTAAARGGVVLWDIDSGDNLNRYEGLRENVVAVGFDHAGERIIAVTATGSGMIWPLDQPDQGAAFATGFTSISRTAFDPSGHWLAVANRGAAHVFDTRTGARICDTIGSPDAPAIAALAVNSDARWCATSNAAGRIRIAPVTPRDQ